jgi:hypothetical protein
MTPGEAAALGVLTSRRTCAADAGTWLGALTPVDDDAESGRGIHRCGVAARTSDGSTARAD